MYIVVHYCELGLLNISPGTTDGHFNDYILELNETLGLVVFTIANYYTNYYTCLQINLDSWLIKYFWGKRRNSS